MAGGQRMQAVSVTSGGETQRARVPDPIAITPVLRQPAPRPPTPRPSSARIARGHASYHAGLAAENAVARTYANAGAAILARRWRCREGEIDLIIRDADGIAFVEVKARSQMPDHDPVSPAQWERLEAAALRYMISAETGTAPLRFDLALVVGAGDVEVTKNARL